MRIVPLFMLIIANFPNLLNSFQRLMLLAMRDTSRGFLQIATEQFR